MHPTPPWLSNDLQWLPQITPVTGDPPFVNKERRGHWFLGCGDSGFRGKVALGSRWNSNAISFTNQLCGPDKPLSSLSVRFPFPEMRGEHPCLPCLRGGRVGGKGKGCLQAAACPQLCPCPVWWLLPTSSCSSGPSRSGQTTTWGYTWISKNPGPPSTHTLSD